MGEFAAVFAGVEDPRTGDAKRRELLEMLLIALCTALSGRESCADMALFGRVKQDVLKEVMPLRHGIPSHDTFGRVFRLLAPAPFRRGFVAFMRRFAETCQGVMALAGKTLRRSFDRAKAASPRPMVHAFAAEARLVLGPLAVDGPSNAITALPQLLALLSLKGTIVTADAMNGQREIARQVCVQGGDDALALKGNPGRLFGDVRLVLADPDTPLASATEAGHGRIEGRPAFVRADSAWLPERRDWPGLAAIGKVVASRGSPRPPSRLAIIS